MSTLATSARTGASADAWRGWLTVHAWSARRRLLVAMAIGVIAATAASAACLAGDPLGVGAARSALAAARQQHADAHRALSRLPALRAELARSAFHAPHAGNAADDIRRVSQLAAEAGLALQMLEPDASGGSKAEAFRSMKLGAQGGFASLRSLLEALAREPSLTAPSELAIRRNGETLAISATLRFFDSLPPASAAVPASEMAAPAFAARRAPQDPFAPALAASASQAQWRLAGLLTDRRRAVALLETPDGVVAAQAGDAIAGGRVTSVDARRVVIAAGGATQTLAWQEAAK
ncbi:hypothetical protein [Paraburkholderia sp. J41]|uniref:hypothetical protein n=1 Tax=Paraburkholderia sp. J41 TaxID=2805433 RepID=UPI002AC342E8|nr:hypothetical protein [Paraburkholderia sp. J41]